MTENDPAMPQLGLNAPTDSLQIPARPLDLKTSVRSSSTHIAAAQLVSKVLGFFVSLYILRFFLPEDQGRYSWFLGIVVYFQFFSNLGLSESLQRFIPEYFSRHEYRRILRTYQASALIILGLSLGVFSVVALFYEPFAAFFKMAEYKPAFYIFALSTILYLQYATLGLILNGLFLHRYQVWGQTVYIAIKAGAMYLFLQMGFGLKGIFLADICGYGPVFLVLLFLFARWMSLRLPRSEGTPGAIETARIAKYSALNTLYTPGALMFDYSTDYVVLNHYVPAAEAGLYSFATRTSRMLLQVLPQKMVESVIRPAFYVRYTSVEDKRPALHEMFNSLCRLNLFFLLPMLVFVILAGKAFIPLIRPEYADGYLLLVFTFAFICASFFDLPADLVIQALEKIKYRSIAQIFGLMNLGLDIAAIKLGYGILGVVFATGISIIVRNLFVLYFARKFSGIRFEWASYGRIAINSAAMGLVIFPIIHFLPRTAGLILSCLVGGSAYLAMTLFLSPFTEKEQGQFLFLARLRKH